MKTQDEIVNRLNKIKAEDFFGFESNDLLSALDFEHAKSFLKEGTTEVEWMECMDNLDAEGYRDKIRDYLPFAWDKANNERGLSASRSQSHFRAWMFIAGDDDVIKKVESAGYEPYGKPMLSVIENHYCSARVAP